MTNAWSSRRLSLNLLQASGDGGLSIYRQKDAWTVNTRLLLLLVIKSKNLHVESWKCTALVDYRTCHMHFSVKTKTLITAFTTNSVECCYFCVHDNFGLEMDENNNVLNTTTISPPHDNTGARGGEVLPQQPVAAHLIHHTAHARWIQAQLLAGRRLRVVTLFQDVTGMFVSDPCDRTNRRRYVYLKALTSR